MNVLPLCTVPTALFTVKVSDAPAPGGGAAAQGRSPASPVGRERVAA
jgi:hypothetical protein